MKVFFELCTYNIYSVISAIEEKALSSFFIAYCRNFVEEKLGVKYTEGRKTDFAKSFKESGPASPVFFILSPGVDPLKDVESLGKIHKEDNINVFLC